MTEKHVGFKVSRQVFYLIVLITGTNIKVLAGIMARMAELGLKHLLWGTIIKRPVLTRGGGSPQVRILLLAFSMYIIC